MPLWSLWFAHMLTHLFFPLYLVYGTLGVLGFCFSILDEMAEVLDLSEEAVKAFDIINMKEETPLQWEDCCDIDWHGMADDDSNNEEDDTLFVWDDVANGILACYRRMASR
jgi:hypothetical protein